MGLRETLFATYKDRPAPLAVATPEWPTLDGQIYVRKLTAGELDKFYAEIEEGSERAPFVALVACGPDNAPLFKESDADDLAELAFEPIDRIAFLGQQFNGMLPEQRKDRLKN